MASGDRLFLEELVVLGHHLENTMPTSKLLRHIHDHPHLHRHPSYDQLIACCEVDGIIDTMALLAHKELMPAQPPTTEGPPRHEFPLRCDCSRCAFAMFSCKMLPPSGISKLRFWCKKGRYDVHAECMSQLPDFFFCDDFVDSYSLRLN